MKDKDITKEITNKKVLNISRLSQGIIMGESHLYQVRLSTDILPSAKGYVKTHRYLESCQIGLMMVYITRFFQIVLRQR